MGKQIVVKGASGAGKTTFAAELARRLGVPHIELDALHHGPNWSEATAEEFRARVRAAMDADPSRGWVIDGNYERKLDALVTDAADTVVWLDLPLRLLLWRLWTRTSYRIRNNVELWNGNRESWRTAVWGRESLFVWAIRSFIGTAASGPAAMGPTPASSGCAVPRTPAAGSNSSSKILFA